MIIEKTIKENITALVDFNIGKVYEIAEKITQICSEPICFEQILQKLFNDYNLKMNFEQYVLVGSTVRSYLAWLKDCNQLMVDFDNSVMLWKRI